MNLAPVTELLRRRIGLDPESLGPTVLPRAVAARMQALGLSAPDVYGARLAGDAEELQRLIDDVAVPETWFFRGGEVFAYLARHVRDVVRRRPAGEPFRVLSVPCSTGEEPYSLALALAEAEVPAATWTIDAVDLSMRHVERARAGMFRDFSFRETGPELRRRYFRAVEGGWELDLTVRSLVRFRVGNLLDPHFPSGEAPYDLIFCRNLLIYLHPEARRQALDALLRLLAPDALVCAGHAEPLDFLDPRFARAGSAGSFLYRRAPARPEPPARAVPEPIRPMPPVPPAPSNPPAPAAPPVDAVPSPADTLAQARRLADGGRLAEALDACRACRAAGAPSADLFSLMGVIHQARGERDDAVRCFEQALYLERSHPEALTHLMLLCRERGDHAQADRLRRRLERVSPGGEP